MATRPGAARPQPLLPPMLAAGGGTTLQLFLFFFKTGCLVFGSGLIVPFLESAVVGDFGWLTERQFLDSVTVGLVSPGPVVITATFVGYLVNGLAGAAAATTGMFLPAILFTLVATPIFMRHRRHPHLAGAVRGITAAVVGMLGGTVPLVARGAVVDAATAAILAGGLVLAWRRLLPEPILILAGALAGLLFGP
ncbi:MAG: chromate transporter [Vicinamibacterales bacterium]